MQNIKEKLIDLLTGHSLDTYEDVQCVADELIAKSVIPVCRCKDCARKTHDSMGRPWCNARETYTWDDNAFCSYGERKGGEK